MNQYHDLVRGILDHGIIRDDRTGVGTRSVFGRQLRFDLRAGFPLLTTRKIHWRSIVAELLWMLRGDSNVRSLQKDGITIWDEWADENGDLGPVYGVQWRHWGGDQLKRVISEIRTNPTSRRLIVSAWNAAEIDRMALPPCHALFQFYVNLSSTNSNPTPAGQEQTQTDGFLDCHLYQRSSDVFLGLPFNIASYALLTHMVAHVCGLSAGDLIISIGDAHLYRNHEEQARLLLTRDHLPAPTLRLNSDLWRSQIDRFTADDISLENYQHHPAISAPVAI